MENVNVEKVKQLLSEGKKLVVDFWAPWCGACRPLIPRLESIEKEYSEIVFVKVNVDENREQSMEFGVNSLPTVMVFNGETLVNRSVGAQSDVYYKQILNSL